MGRGHRPSSIASGSSGAGILADVDALARLARSGAESDADLLAAVKYRLITAWVARVARRITVAEGWAPPETNADAIGTLGAHGVVDDELARSLAAAMGFRNVLVHGYADVDDSRVVAFLGRLDDLRRYSSEVAAWLRGQPS